MRHEKPALAGAMQHHAPTKRQETSSRGGTSPRGKKPRQEVEPHHAVISKNKRLEPVQLLPVKRLAHWSQKGLRGSLHSHGLLYSLREWMWLAATSTR